MPAPLPRREDVRAIAWVAALLVLPLVLAHLVGHAPAPAPGIGDGAPPLVHEAFWSIFVMIASAIWTGIQAAGRVTLQILQWSVKALWAFATSIYAGLKTVGAFVATAGRKVWDFFRWTYESVLKPAWDYLWKLFDRVRRTLEKVFRPVFEFLHFLKDELLGFYTKWIRPILDIIDITRRALRILASLGLDFARTLDRKLAALEEKIDAPFRYALAKLNEIVNLLNRIVTADGLFQRLVLLRSVARDFAHINGMWWAANIRPLTAEERAALARTAEPVPFEQHVAETRAAILEHTGPLASVVDEAAEDVKLLMKRVGY